LSFLFINKISVSFTFYILIFCYTSHTYTLIIGLFNFQLVSELGTICLDLFLECYPFDLYFFFNMSQNLMTFPVFDGTNYGYWKAHMRFFVKFIDCWKTGWTEPADTNIELVNEKNARLSNDKALHALCQAFSPSDFTKISNCGTTQEAWQILETTYEGTKLVKSVKLQMLISIFEEIKMLDDETFREFYSKMSDLINLMVSLGKFVLDVKHI
jgi:hypothetical protein